ncbi:MAG TPA: hypothetical protein PLU30_02470 [Verrucomicrobiae bacterium]|nr:hypothetical protein [Verrucomicrobiae bacterium]
MAAAKRKRKNRFKGIARVDQIEKRQHGFLVRLQRRGERHSAFFSDREHGGRLQALSAARRHYNLLCRKHPASTRRDFAERMTARNTSGRVGVSLTRSVAANSKTYESFSSSCSLEKGCRITKKFSISRYGRKKAYEMACRWREAMVRKMAR